MGTQLLLIGEQGTHQTALELRVEDHLRKLRKCDTSWMGFIVGYEDGSSETIFGRNFCKQRDCDQPACMQHRISLEYRKIMDILVQFRRRQCSHVTLTFGQNQEIDGKTLSRMKHLVKLFFRQIQYSGGGRYRAVIIYELKRQPNGLYHCHCHIGFERSPHLEVVVEKWNKINGKTTRADVKYNTSKEALARYFARRVALGGVGMPVEDFVAAMRGRQLVNTYGVEKRKDTERLPPDRVHSNLVGTRNYETKKKIAYVTFLGTMPKMPGETIPPPLEEWGFS